MKHISRSNVFILILSQLNTVETISKIDFPKNVNALTVSLK